MTKCYSPFLVSDDLLQKLFDFLILPHAAEIFFQILYCLVMCQHISCSSSNLHHVLTGFLNDVRHLKQQVGSTKCCEFNCCDSRAKRAVLYSFETTNKSLHVPLTRCFVEIEKCSSAQNFMTTIGNCFVKCCLTGILWQFLWIGSFTRS